MKPTFWVNFSVLSSKVKMSKKKVVSINSPETSVSNHLTLLNNPEDGRIHLKRGGSLKHTLTLF
jgi:hypothetical protein